MCCSKDITMHIWKAMTWTMATACEVNNMAMVAVYKHAFVGNDEDCYHRHFHCQRAKLTVNLVLEPLMMNV